MHMPMSMPMPMHTRTYTNKHKHKHNHNHNHNNHIHLSIAERKGVMDYQCVVCALAYSPNKHPNLGEPAIRFCDVLFHLSIWLASLLNHEVDAGEVARQRQAGRPIAGPCHAQV